MDDGLFEEGLAPGARLRPLHGFLGGETNQWYPDLAEDNHYIEQPYAPGDGYHLSKDLADKALEFIRDSKQSEPDKPWYLWFCPGANHAPHHAPQEYIDKYKGRFDDGYEAYREWVLPRMVERGILPEDTELTPINPMTPGTFSEGDSVRPWETLSEEEKRLFSRMAEVYAALSEYTDAQVGRIIDYLEESGQLDNTVVIYAADNGASGEGSPNGSVNENKFFNAWPDTIEDNLPFIDKLGTPETYNHYPTGWAVAFSTPYRMFKRYSYQGGVCDPLVISWPKGIPAGGEVRSQYHHCTDIVPTILECCGVEMPEVVDGYEQTPLPGVSMRYSFDAADAPTTKETQYYEMLGTRAIWHKGWKAVTEHGPVPIGRGRFDQAAGSSSTPTSTAPRPTIWQTSTRRSSRTSSTSGSRKRRSTTSCRSTISRSSSSGHSSTSWPCHRPGSTPTTRARPRFRRRRRRRPPTRRTRSWPRSSSPATPRA